MIRSTIPVDARLPVLVYIFTVDGMFLITRKHITAVARLSNLQLNNRIENLKY